MSQIAKDAIYSLEFPVYILNLENIPAMKWNKN